MKITKSELREIIQEVADELGLFEGLTAAQEKLPEPLKKAILKKQGNSDSSDDETEDVEEGLTAAQEKLPEPLKKAILKKQGNSDEEDENSVDAVKEELTKAQEKLPEPLKNAILKKQGNTEESDDSEEEAIEEGNAFGAAIKAARENGDKEFEVSGKKYKLKEKKEITEQEDTEEFTGEEDGDSEFEVGGKTYKVSEDWSKIAEVECPECGQNPCEEVGCSEDDDDVEEGNAFGDAVTKAKEDGDSEFEVGGKTYKVKENWTKVTLAEKLDRMLGNRKIL
jgi:ribosomal protein L16/L10AE